MRTHSKVAPGQLSNVCDDELMMAKSEAWFVEPRAPAIRENRSQTAGQLVPAEAKGNTTAALSSRIEEPVTQD